MSVRVSVVVPTYRREELLAKCLERLVDQSLPPDAYEIIVADDGPTPQTQSCVARFRRADGPRLTYVPVQRTQGPAGARNAGWRLAAGEVIAFTDDDCLPERAWLEYGLEAIDGADAVTGKTVVPLPPEPTDFERNLAGLETAEFITANCFVRKAALEAVGGFDERFTLAWREDSDLHFALLTGGYSIRRAPRAMVVHPARKARWGVCIREQRKGLFDPLLYKKFPKLYRQRIAPLPRMYYAAIVGLGAGGAGLLAGAPVVAGMGLAVWGAVTLWLTARRLRATSRDWRHVVEMAATSAALPVLSVYWRLRGAWRFGVLYL